MNAYAHGACCHGRTDRGVPAVVALLMMVACGPTTAWADQVALPDGGVLISDGVVDSMPVDGGIDDGVVADGSPGPEAFQASEGFPVGLPLSQRPRWDVAVDALLLWQGTPQSLPLLINEVGNPALTSADLRTQLTAGPRVSLIRAVGECYAIEGNYFQARPFDASRQVPALGGPYTMANFGDASFADIESGTLTGNGSIQSAELNWRRNELGSPITWIAGFRWVELNSQATFDYAFANPDPYGSGSVDVVSGNNLYGGQAGADLRLWNTGGRWRANAIGKAGLFGNANAYQRSTAGFVTTGGDPVPLGAVAATANQVAFFGEAGLYSTYWITNWLAWRAGYTVFWAAGVAVASQQFPLNNFGDGTATINTSGSVMLHGVTTGFEARW